MKILTRTFSKYINVEVEVDSGKFDLGFHSVEEAKELRDHLQEQINDINDQVERIESLVSITKAEGMQ
tara:strand:- start:274 stop:477 length:204 start_codon:yes stop_codon:yes gene_type:complete